MTACNNTSQADYHEYHQNTLIVASVLSTFGLLGNVLVIVLASRAKDKKSTTTYLLLSLAIADIVNLLGVNTFIIWHYLDGEHHKRAMLLLSTFPAKIVTTFTLAMLALERYKAVIKSTFVNITRKRILVVITVVWLVGVTLCASIVTMVDKHRMSHAFIYALWVILFLTHLIPFTIILICYTRILKSLYLDGKILGLKIRDVARMDEMKRLIRILIVITFVFLACNLPTVVVLVMKFYRVHDPNMKHIYLAAAVSGCISSALNPYVYGLQSEKYRSQVKELCCHVKEENEVDVESHEVYDTKL